MPLGGGAVQTADIAHVGEPLGREIDRALAQGALRGVIDQRVRQSAAERLGGAIEIWLDRRDGVFRLIAHMAGSPLECCAGACPARRPAAMAILVRPGIHPLRSLDWFKRGADIAAEVEFSAFFDIAVLCSQCGYWLPGRLA